MTMYLGDFSAGSVIYVPFNTFNAAGGSVTITGLAVTDIEIYKNGSTTQRSSDAGYTLLDTDGIDFDGLTGIHGFSVNTGDNTDSGFFSSGADYWIVVSAITVDSQTVSFVAATFSIENRCALRPTTAGRTLDITSGGNAGIDLDNIALTNGCGPFGIQASGTLSGTHSATTADLGTNAPATDIAGMTLTIPSRGFARFVTSYNTGTGVATFDSTSASLTNGDQWYLVATPTVSSALPIASNIVQANGVAVTSSGGRMEVNTTHAAGTAWNSGAITASTLASDTITAAKVASDVTTELQSGLATASSISTLTGYVDTEVAAIKAVTDKLDTALELDGAVYRYTTNALEQAPSGGGGTADWTADERTAIRSILGIPGSGTTPADPSTGILDTIRDAVAGVQSDTNDIQTRIPAALVSGRMDVSVGAMASGVLTASALATDAVAEIVDAVFDEALSGHTTAGTAGWSLQLSGEVIDDTTITGTPTTTQIQLTAGSAVDDFYNDQLLYIVSGTGVGQVRPILDYVGATRTITVDEPFVTTPASGARVIIRAAHVYAKSQIAASVWADSTATTLIGNIGDIETDTTDIQSRLPATLVSGRIDASVGAMSTDVITSTALAASAVTEIQSGLATASALSTLDDFVDTEVAAIKAVTDKLDTALEIDGAVYKYTINALENAPSGGGGGTTDWTANERDAIRAILGVPASGTTPDDPTSGILDTIRDAVAGLNDLSSGDVQTAVGAALSTYDAATGSDITSATSGLATAAALATVDSVVDTILLDTNDIQTRLPAALVSGRMDASVGAMASNVLTAAALATDAVTEIQSGLATASALSTVSGYIDTEVAAILAIANKLDTMLALDGAVYQFTTNALENGPSGGGGTADWTADERTAIRAILGIPGSGTTPADPSTGILDTIRDAIAALNNLSSAGVEAAAETALADYGAATAANVSAVTSAITSLINGLNDVSVTQILTTQMTESYAANGTAPTLAQALFAIHQYLMEFAITGTTYRVRRLDSSTTAFDVTLDDDTSPTSATR